MDKSISLQWNDEDWTYFYLISALGFAVWCEWLPISIGTGFGLKLLRSRAWQQALFPSDLRYWPQQGLLS